MLRYHSHPFLKAAEATSGAGGVSVPAAGGPDSAPYAKPGQASDAKHPLDATPRSILDDDEGDLGAELRKGSSKSSRGTEDKGEQRTPAPFEKGFDPSTLEEPLQGAYRELEKALGQRMAALPDSQTISLLGQKAQAFDALLSNPDFLKWADSLQEQMTGKKSEPSVGQSAADEAANLLEGLDEDVQRGISQLIQRTVDQEIASRVTPISDAFYAREADQVINALKQEVGAENFERLAPTMQRLMEQYEGIGVQEAYKLAAFDSLKTATAKRDEETVEDKFRANMEDDGSIGTEPARKSQARTPREAVEMALDMIQRGDPRAFDPTRLPPGYRGE